MAHHWCATKAQIGAPQIRVSLVLSRSMVLAENVIKNEICGLAMVVSVFVAMRNWLGVP
jgi:hypothetical protein